MGEEAARLGRVLAGAEGAVAYGGHKETDHTLRVKPSEGSPGAAIGTHWRTCQWPVLVGLMGTRRPCKRSSAMLRLVIAVGMSWNCSAETTHLVYFWASNTTGRLGSKPFGAADGGW
eukprot:GGOE01049750.1.p2 GENE.GGOE01049750.1~~GGOE01049750.1.p2  ORF type:complete len:117 (+),score=3.59 GGOE01049750.1:116-466(+)